MPHVLITTVPFADRNRFPLEMLEANGVDYRLNPLNRKLTEEELIGMVADVGVIIAGTEPITAKVMKSAPHLKHISRVGVGLDNVDLVTAEKRGIKVSYTPDAPAPAVAPASASPNNPSAAPKAEKKSKKPKKKKAKKAKAS
jgi:D-3-phosphoglycerate dehydrogenase